MANRHGSVTNGSGGSGKTNGKGRARAKKRRHNPRSNGQPIIILGHTLGAIARGIGKDSGHLSRLVRNTRRPSVATLESLRVFLKLETLDETAKLFCAKAIAEGQAEIMAHGGAYDSIERQTQQTVQAEA